MTRFQNKPCRLSDFDKKVYVHCPRCKLRALVHSDFPDYVKPTIKCPNCSFTQIGRKESYEISVHTNCSTCGHKIDVQLPYCNQPRTSLNVKCKECGISQEYSPKNTNVLCIYESDFGPCDPYFQLPLWLRGSFRGHYFYAYNYEHLNYLKGYISATMREKNEWPIQTMVERLPKWMTAAKNRAAIIKIIEKLERK